MKTNLIEYLKNDEGQYFCLENNKQYKHPRAIINLLNLTYDMTLIDYCIKWELVNIKDYINCEICGKYTDSIGKHLSVKHKDFGGVVEYSKHYINASLISNNYKIYLTDKMKGDKNHNHKSRTTALQRQQLSPFSIEFWKFKYSKLSNIELENLLIQFRDSALSDREFTSQLDYYIERGYTYDESIILLKERQTTFSKDICIKKYGEIEGNIIFNKRQERWLDSLLNNDNLVIGYSKISQDLFDNIKRELPKNNIVYATHNSELRLKTENNKIYLYDFADIDNKKIIEFHGDLFHGNPNMFNANDTPHPFRKNILAKDMWRADKIKYDTALYNGYDILVIWESEYKRKGIDNKNTVIKKCIDFILS